MREMKDSGIEWIGKIPKAWKVEKLCKVVPIITDFVASGSFATINNNVEYLDYPDYAMLVRTADLSGTKDKRVYIDKHAYNFLSNSNLFGGEVILSNIGSVGNVYMYEPLYERSSLAPNAIMLNGSKNNRYVYYWFLSPHSNEELKRIGGNAVQLKFNKTQLRQFKIAIPSIEEQQKISAYLDDKCTKIDSIIEKQQKIIDKLKEYKQSIITEAVTKGLNPDVKMKDSGIEWIGEIPEHWNITILSALFREHKCKNKGMLETNLLSLSYGKIKRKNITTNKGLLPDSFENYNIINKGNIVFRLTDLQNDKKSLRAGLCKEKGIITSAYVTLELKQNDRPVYMYYLFYSYDLCKVFYGMGDGVRQGANYEDLKKLKLIRPSFSEQQQIADYLDKKCSAIDSAIEKKQAIIEKLTEYKKSLIYEVVTGKKGV